MTERRYIDRPEPGYYKTRLVRGGWEVGVRIFVEADRLAIEIDGERCDRKGQPFDVYAEWPWLRPDTEANFRFLARTREWANLYEPEHPAANPWRPIDLSRLPPRF